MEPEEAFMIPIHIHVGAHTGKRLCDVTPAVWLELLSCGDTDTVEDRVLKAACEILLDSLSDRDIWRLPPEPENL